MAQTLVVKSVRGFPSDFFIKIRERPCTALLRVMERRFKTTNEADFDTTKRNGDLMVEALRDCVTIPGLRVSPGPCVGA